MLICCRSLILLVLLLLVLPVMCYGQKIEVLLAGHMGQINAFRQLLQGEPLVRCTVVPCRAVGTSLSTQDAQKYIRLYFPRTSEQVRSFGFIILTAVEYDLLSPKQDRWMYDAIREGTGGINDGSVFSIVGTIISAWANSLTSKAFPNNADAVADKGGGRSGLLSFRVTINRDFRDPVLTLFLPYGVENAPCQGCSNMVIPREGAGTLAWQHGNFPTRRPYIAVWDYEEGRTYTCGSFIPGGWFNYPDNPYSAEILINLIFYSTKRKLIHDVEVFHMARSSMMQYSMRMAILISLKDFIDNFDANTQVIEDQIGELDTMYQKGVQHYTNLEFLECEQYMDGVLRQFSEAEKIAIKLKDSALFWVHLIEWLVVSSALSISGFILWTLMIRRKLYRVARTTRLT